MNFAYGALTLYGRTFQSIQLPTRFVTPRLPCGTTILVLQPPLRNAHRLPRNRFRLLPLSLATTQGIENFFLFLRVLRCVISPGSLHAALCVQAPVTGHYTRRVSPFGDLCFTVRLRLHTAYRSLPRPSSAFGAKASTIRSYYLNGSFVSRFRTMQFSKTRRLRSRGRTLATEPKRP